MKYAVFSVNGRQYKASEGAELLLETKSLGVDKVEFDNVLLINDDGEVEVGNPTIANAKVVAQVVGQEKGGKIRVVKYKAKSRYRRTYGHRTKYLRVKVQKITKAS